MLSIPLLLLPGAAMACTSVLVPTPDGAVIGRTMELGIPRGPSESEKIYTYPRGVRVHAARGTLNASQYGFIAFQFAVENFTLDVGTTEGINEAGFTVSVQTHTFAEYEAPDPSARGHRRSLRRFFSPRMLRGRRRGGGEAAFHQRRPHARCRSHGSGPNPLVDTGCERREPRA